MPGDQPSFNEPASISAFQKAVPKPSEYLMDQINLEKRSKKEIADALKQEGTKSEEGILKPVAPSPAECQMTELNNQLNSSNQQFKEAESFQELPPVTRAVSEYFMDQIKLEKRTKSEIADALTQQDQKTANSEDSTLRSARACPSEYQMTALNNELSANPMVLAFNELERRKKQA